jgi:DNA-binding transcriptional ArsR family regulator
MHPMVKGEQGTSQPPLVFLHQLMGDVWIDAAAFGKNRKHPLGQWSKKGDQNPWVAYNESLAQEILTSEKILHCYLRKLHRQFRMHTSRCLRALFPYTRYALLAFTLSHGEEWWYMSELAAALRKTPSSLQRELRSLVAAGLLQKKTKGRRVYYRAHPHSAVVSGLQQIFRAASEKAAA